MLRSTGSWLASFPHLTSRLGLTRRSQVWLPGPLSSTMNLCAAVHARWVGAPVSEQPYGATHAYLTPSALVRALENAVPLAGVHVVVAGDRLSRAVHDRATAAGIHVSHYYGATELSFVGWGAHEADLRPFPEVEVESRAGVLWVRSPFLCEGYDGPAGEMERDADGFATVGDRGDVVDGRLAVAGRGAAAVTTAGSTGSVADIESVLRPVVEGEVVVLGVHHAELGQVVTAVLTDPTSFPQARAHARSSLSPAQRPRLWFSVDALPLTAADKVDRVALAELVTCLGRGVRRLT